MNPNTDQWVSDLQSDDWQVRWRAAEALAENGDSGSLEALETVCRDPYWEVRHAALQAFSSAGNGKHLPLLLEALADPMYRIGQKAIDGLVRIGLAAVGPLIEVLGDSRPELATGAATALGQLGPDAQPALRALVSDWRQPEAVRLAAGEALGKIEEAWSDVGRGAIAVAQESAIRDGAIAVAESEKGAGKGEPRGSGTEAEEDGWKPGKESWWRRWLRKT